MSTITITPNQLASIASVGVAASKDDVTPVIMSVHLRVEDGFLFAAATDRYRVAEVSFPLFDRGESIPDVIVPVKWLLDVAKQHKASKDRSPADPHITIEVEEVGLVITIKSYDQQWTSRSITGNYPPVTRLFPKVDDDDAFGEVDTVRLNLQMLLDASKIVHPAYSELASEKFVRTIRFTKSSSEGRKSAPLIVQLTIPKGEGFARYMLQPNLLHR